MATLKAVAKLDLAKGETNKKGVVLKTNRYKVEGEASGMIYIPGDNAPKEIKLTLG